MTDEELKRLEELAGKATPGPWLPKHLKTAYLSTGGGEHEVRSRETGSTVAALAFDEEGLPQADADAEFIAAARSAVPELVAEVRRLRRQLEACAEIAESYGPSRPPTHPAREYLHRHEGECAASSNIARLIRERLK